MPYRSLLLAAALSALLGVGLAAFLLEPEPDSITRANCEWITPGMTPADVEAILGGASTERFSRLDDSEPDLFGTQSLFVRTLHIWDGAAGCVWVGFDCDERALNAWYVPRSTLLERVVDRWQMFWATGGL